MFKYPESFTEMKEVAPGASLTDGKQRTRPYLTDSETGNALGRRVGSNALKSVGLRYCL